MYKVSTNNNEELNCIYGSYSISLYVLWFLITIGAIAFYVDYVIVPGNEFNANFVVFRIQYGYFMFGIYLLFVMIAILRRNCRPQNATTTLATPATGIMGAVHVSHHGASTGTPSSMHQHMVLGTNRMNNRNMRYRNNAKSKVMPSKQIELTSMDKSASTISTPPDTVKLDESRHIKHFIAESWLPINNTLSNIDEEKEVKLEISDKHKYIDELNTNDFVWPNGTVELRGHQQSRQSDIKEINMKSIIMVSNQS